MAILKDNAWEGPLQEFRHAELRSSTCIRLVQIHAGLFRGDISCTLQQYETDTQTCPDYAALSYRWGDSTPAHTIYVNGLVYRVHRSLWEFLLHRQTKEDTEHVWIWTDLLCIDQAHHSEKNEQISRMGDIYSQAAYVISWLGNDLKQVVALRNLVEICNQIDSGCAQRHTLERSQIEQMIRACSTLGREEAYWERVWIVQEIACARHCMVTCGDFSIELEGLWQMMKTETNDHTNTRTVHIENLVDLKTSIQQGKTMKFIRLIQQMMFCEATEDRDKIYGLLGLARRLDPGFDSHALGISQHKSLEDVWWDMIFMIIERESNVGIKRDLAALQAMAGWLPPPRHHWKLEMESSIRTSCAETVCLAFEAAFSRTIQEFLGTGLSGENRVFMLSGEYQTAWDEMTAHVSENDVPGLQERLFWSAFAGLSFIPPYDVWKNTSQEFEDSLPSGWFCAAHWPYILNETTRTARRRIKSIRSFEDLRPESRRVPSHCSGAKHDGPRCDLSLVVLRIEPLGVTCLVRSANRVKIDFYCDCCDPSAGWAKPPLQAEMLSLGSFLPTLTTQKTL